MAAPSNDYALARLVCRITSNGEGSVKLLGRTVPLVRASHLLLNTTLAIRGGRQVFSSFVFLLLSLCRSEDSAEICLLYEWIEARRYRRVYNR